MFTLEKDIDVAAQEVRDKVEHRSCRPAERHRAAGRHARSTPTPRRCSTSALRSKGSRSARRDRGRRQRVRRQLESVTGVGQVTSSAAASARSTSGSTPLSCARTGLTPADVQRALARRT